MTSVPPSGFWSMRRLVEVGAIVCALLVLLTFVLGAGEDLRYRFRGVSVEGRVVEETVTPVGFFHGNEFDGGTRPVFRHRLLYSYIDRSGQTHTGKQEWENANEHPAYRPGDTLWVRYLGDEPHLHRTASGGAYETALALLLAVPIGTGIVLLAMALRRKESLATLVGWLGRRLPGRRRRAAAASAALPFAWERAIRHNVGLYLRLPPAEQARLAGLVHGFLEGKQWEGCNGLEITDEVRATIAAQACVLLLGTIDHDHFSSVKSILVYPTTFGTGGGRHDLEDQVATLGQAWYRGPVILAWDEVLAGGGEPDGGRNVVYHEFAHQLDFQGPDLEAALSDEATRKRQRWCQVMQSEYDDLVHATQQHRHTLLDPYGATNTREFFAVASECFFGRPIEMELMHPRLYEVLRDFYGQDPGQRLRNYQSLAASAARRDRL